MWAMFGQDSRIIQDRPVFPIVMWLHGLSAPFAPGLYQGL